MIAFPAPVLRRWHRGLVTLLALASFSFSATGSALRPGEFTWNPELSADGPLVIIISLSGQTLSAYRNGIRIGYSSISSGRKGRSTPAGVFTILEKQVVHYSSKYHHAPMPYMQRLTWEGVALHGGDLPGYPASHGCIRLPRPFAKLLYSVTARGTTVIVVNEKAPRPVLTNRPGMVWWPNDAGMARPLRYDFEWEPERSAEGPITILASAADRMLYVYRNGHPIGRAAIEIRNPKRPLGSHVFVMLDGLSGTLSAFVPGKPAHRWMAVKTEGHASLRDLAPRVRVPPEFAAKLYEILSPPTTIVVTDGPALPGMSTRPEIPLMESERSG